ncbi:hypothetical protein B0H21DRAFT_723087 [Amylocystis lapponica]|nr:hypothetical protein B0H21DRAFT_723087 [Amylocystis lapponica]
MEVDIGLNPTEAAANAIRQGTAFNNQAMQLSNSGDLQGAERLYLRAIAIKEHGLGLDHPTTALSWNAIGELYIQLGRLDEAEDYLSKAVRVRNVRGGVFDGAVSRENLAQVYEMRGNLQQAKDMRMSGAPDKFACSNYKCVRQTLHIRELSHCSICKSINYCSKNCQKQDWKRHKKYCHSLD